VTNGGAGTYFQQSTLPFGTALNAESTGYSNQIFTSYDRSPGTGLDYAVNRTYSPGQSRFTQVDPIGMAAASLGAPQSNNLYAYVQNMPTDFVDPSGLNIALDCRWAGQIIIGDFRYDVWQCTLYDRGTGGGGPAGPPIIDSGGGGRSGGRTEPPVQPQKPKKKRCKQDKKGGDRKDIEAKLKAAGVWHFIDNIETLREGIVFDIADREGFLRAVNSNPAFANNTIFRGQHVADVGATSRFQVSDHRSYTTGVNTLGPDSTVYVRSLQIAVGPGALNPAIDNPNNQTTRGWADLDCSNPAQDLVSLIKHIFGR
jgi:RHS repeat-associated protein